MGLIQNNKEDMPKTIYLGYTFRDITLDRIYEIAEQMLKERDNYL